MSYAKFLKQRAAEEAKKESERRKALAKAAKLRGDPPHPKVPPKGSPQCVSRPPGT